MKKIIAIGIISMFLLTSISVFAITIKEGSNFNSIIMNYSFETPVIATIDINGNIYDQITINGAPCTGNPGEPRLPAKGAYILLPQGEKVKGIVVTHGDKVDLGSRFNIEPVGESVPISDIDNAPLPVPNKVIYSSKDMFPGKLFTKVGTYSFRGYEILVLKLHPVQYVPASGELFYYTDLTVTVETEKASDNSLFRGLVKDKEEVMKKVDNPEVADTYSSESGGSPLSIQYKLVIITTDALKDYYIPLADEHNATGNLTFIKTVEDITNNPDYWVTGEWGDANPDNPFIDTPVTANLSHFNDTQAKIRNFIREAYTNWGIEYVLLGGDNDTISTRGLIVRAHYFIENIPSDLYFACLDGSLNSNFNEYWGEYNDGENGGDIDLSAEVYVGRACTDDATEVQNFVDKTIAYMNTDRTDSYLKKVLMVGEYLGWGFGGMYMNELIIGSTKHGYTTVGFSPLKYRIHKLYGLWSKVNLIRQINNNVHIINHLGHSYYKYNMKLNNSDVDNLTNDKYCFIYSQGCMAGGFDRNDCIAEYFTVKTTHGAFAGVWNTREGLGTGGGTDGPSQRYHREFWDAVFNESIKVISKANQDSREDNLWRIDEPSMRFVYYELTLFGDPSVQFKYVGSESNQNDQSSPQSNPQSNPSPQNQQSSQLLIQMMTKTTSR